MASIVAEALADPLIVYPLIVGAASAAGFLAEVMVSRG